MTAILVTGGAGNVASALVKKMAENADNYIVVADNLLTGNIGKVPLHLPNVKFIKCNVNDYTDISAVFYTYKFDYVFHYAAVVGVQRTLQHPTWVLDDIKGIENILKLAKNTGVRRVYYSSSSEVYGEPVEFPQNEYTTPLNSRLPYAVVKNVGEAFFRSYQQEYGLDYTIFRFFNTYGPNQSEDFVIPRFLKKALNNEDITIYGDGSQTRTFCYVDDNVEACLKAHYGNAFVNDVINIGGAREYSILELAQMAIRLTGSSSQVVHLPPLKEGDMRRRQPDNSKMLALLGRPLLILEEGLKRMIEWYKQNHTQNDN